MDDVEGTEKKPLFHYQAEGEAITVEEGHDQDEAEAELDDTGTMVARGSLGTYKPGPPSATVYAVLVAALATFSLGMGYYVAIQPINEWRYFSWHPFLMTCGMVGLAGVGALTKKLGGYTNTKSHAILSGGSLLLSLAGLYCIYHNKEINGKSHLTSNHAIFGSVVMVSCISLGLVGSIAT